MRIPKEAVMWVMDEGELPLPREEGENVLTEPNGKTAPGVSIWLRNNFCIAVHIPYAKIEEVFQSGWAEIDEDDILVVHVHQQGWRTFQQWHDFWLNLPNKEDAMNSLFADTAGRESCLKHCHPL